MTTDVQIATTILSTGKEVTYEDYNYSITIDEQAEFLNYEELDELFRLLPRKIRAIHFNDCYFSRTDFTPIAERTKLEIAISELSSKISRSTDSRYTQQAMKVLSQLTEAENILIEMEEMSKS